MADTPKRAEDIHSRAEALAGRLPSLLVAAERVASTVAQGVHGRRRVGVGESFWQFRSYESGDPISTIDWRQSAKSDRVYIREQEWEAAQSVWLWRDGTASMDYRSGRNLMSKREASELLLLALACLLVRGGERTALLESGLPPGAGRATLLRMAGMIAAGQWRTDDLPIPEQQPGRPLPRNAHLVLMSDFLDPPDMLQKALAGLVNQGIKGHVIQVLDPAEATLPFTGRVEFRGLERDGAELIPNADAVRHEYLERLEEQRQALRDIVGSIGWQFMTYVTDQPPQNALLRLYAGLAGEGHAPRPHTPVEGG